MSTETIDLVLFEIAGTRFAADLGQIHRIGSVEADQSVGYPLGRPAIGKRALVFTATHTANGNQVEAQLCIDAVLGVHTVPHGDLRRMPIAAAAASRLAIGAWVVDGSQTILIVDLHATVTFSGASA